MNESTGLRAVARVTAFAFIWRNILTTGTDPGLRRTAKRRGKMVKIAEYKLKDLNLINCLVIIFITNNRHVGV